MILVVSYCLSAWLSVNNNNKKLFKIKNKYGDLRRESESNEEIEIFEEDYHINSYCITEFNAMVG